MTTCREWPKLNPWDSSNSNSIKSISKFHQFRLRLDNLGNVDLLFRIVAVHLVGQAESLNKLPTSLLFVLDKLLPIYPRHY